MKTRSLPLIDKITKLEQQKLDLLNKRKEELFKFFLDHSAITIDNKLLLGFLKFATDKNNKDHSTLSMFKELASSSRSRRKPKQQSR